mmetsp:Transcript_10613/g.22239  ORF Transcript_10613/g.22239 Transcript_10613/m.22239 type:complete len:115 (+) Transcript_10613:34-378(+)
MRLPVHTAHTILEVPPSMIEISSIKTCSATKNCIGFSSLQRPLITFKRTWRICPVIQNLLTAPASSPHNKALNLSFWNLASGSVISCLPDGSDPSGLPNTVSYKAFPIAYMSPS